MGIFNSKSTKAQKEPDKFFDRERWREQKRKEKREKAVNTAVKRIGVKDAPISTVALGPGPGPAATPPPSALVQSYEDEALERMRYQLHHDSDAFLLNNILLSVQFFENFEREMHQINNNPHSERENHINEAMVRRNKHVFFADRLQECVAEHVSYQRCRGQLEPLSAPRMFVIYDNVEASEPGDTSDYSAVLDAPFYKLRIEDCKELGYVKLKKLEVLESTLQKEVELADDNKAVSDDSIFTDSEKESVYSDDSHVTKGSQLLEQIKAKIDKSDEIERYSNQKEINLDFEPVENVGRRFSGPVKLLSLQAAKSNLSNLKSIRSNALLVEEEKETRDNSNSDRYDSKPRKSILKTTSRFSRNGVVKSNTNSRATSLEINASEDTETSGYRSNTSSRQNESSETESDYGYATITESATPKKIQLSLQSNFSLTSGVLPDDSWTILDLRAINQWSDDENEEEEDDAASKSSLPRNLYERHYYLNSKKFMSNFVDNFIINLGSGLGLTQDAINNATSQAASIYCYTLKNGLKMNCEVFPALIAAWPNAANQWIIRERKIIQNPRTNFSYQWPTKFMVSKAIGFGCLLVPFGFRAKRSGLNPEQELQWQIIYPAVERYLESFLAHSHIRCYLFTLALHKTFMENESVKLGLEASHIKNHLFRQCENNFAMWPEDRLGESLRLFLISFVRHFGQSRLPNYFMETCNEFKSIPKPILQKLQRKLADIIESPVMHVLNAVDKLKYNKKDFYPTFNCHRLYEILTCKNPLRILNPNLPVAATNNDVSSDSEDDTNTNFWDKAKSRDKHYQWKIERQKQIEERRRAQINIKKQKSLGNQEKEINSKIILPSKMDPERRRLVLDFFITHFIAMARSSEKFEAIKQAVIYLEQAQRLCTLLLEEPSGETTGNEYMEVIRDKLADCQRKLVAQGGFKLPPRRESYPRPSHSANGRHLPKFEQIVNQNSPLPSDAHANEFTFVDVHVEQSLSQMRLNDAFGEESKL